MSSARPDPSAPKRRIFVVDDHPIVRQGLALMINQEPDLTVCGEAESVQAAQAAIPAARPDLLVLDLSLPGAGGFELLRTVRATTPTLPVLVLSMHDEAIYAERTLRAGANGYITKQEATEKVLVAIRRILRGGVYLSDRFTGEMLQQLATGAGRPLSPIASLTDREAEVFHLIGDGHGTRDIAEELGISVKTVESYQEHIKQKLGLQSGRALVQRAIEWRLSERAT